MLCVRCKGNLLCGKGYCPLLTLLEKFKKFKKSELILNSELPSPPSIFVGKKGYPLINLGPVMVNSEENPELYDNPSMWKGDVEDVLALRMNLVRGVKSFHVNSAINPDRTLLEIQELSASLKPIDVEARFEKVIERPMFDDIVQPFGVYAKYSMLSLTENPRIPLKVEKLINDEIKAEEAIYNLHQQNFSTYYIQRLFSVGLFGVKKKLVPTRWSITAVHDIIGERLKKEIRNFDILNEVLLFSFEHFGNRFEIILYPSNYNFQLLEIWIEKSFWNPGKTWIGWDGEDINKKRTYSKLSGGYYASRLPVLEFLSRIRKQAGCIVIREITPEYFAPLGVWVVEEGVRKALMMKPKKFNSIQEAISSIKIKTEKIRSDKKGWIKYLKIFKQSSLDLYSRIL